MKMEVRGFINKCNLYDAEGNLVGKITHPFLNASQAKIVLERENNVCWIEKKQDIVEIRKQEGIFAEGVFEYL